jgi:hypothetical protein
MPTIGRIAREDHYRRQYLHQRVSRLALESACGVLWIVTRTLDHSHTLVIGMSYKDFRQRTAQNLESSGSAGSTGVDFYPHL